ncbi:hypothetical protein [uncultured Pontibacter sp.]|uniref:STAS/SEC14 domain-containing protein n=1 Tax=uncultured Pontibacter sp. TaxID=453356 RepID=UPI00261219B9|nr:hypothetical protein [uncultured Pontibacter sp.]
MELYKSETCAVEFTDNRLVFLCHGKLESQQFREALMKALRFAREHHVKQWLLDLREIGKLSEEEEAWVQVQLFPQIMMHLGTDNHLAVVVDERCYDDMLSESGLLGLRSYNSFIVINTFCQLPEAIAWLDKGQSKCA